MIGLIDWPSRKGEDFTIPKSLEAEPRKADAGQNVPVLKPTQVGEMSILRRSRERS